MPEMNEQTSGLCRQQILQNIQSIKSVAMLGLGGGYPTFVVSERGIFVALAHLCHWKANFNFVSAMKQQPAGLVKEK